MDRRNRNYNNNENHILDESRYENYRNDNAYNQNRRNLTDQFEQEYQRHHRSDDHNRYDQYERHDQGRIGSAFDQYRREEGGFRDHKDDYSQNQRNDRDGNRNYSNNFSRDRDRFSNYQDNFRGDQDIDSSSQNYDSGRNQELRGNIRQGYGISSFDGTSDRFNTLNSEDRKGTGQDEQAYYSGNRDGYRSSQFGGGMGDAFPGSHRGVPDATYGLRNFADDYGTGMGSSYGGKNYGGGTGYSEGHRGGTLGNSSYGTTAGNYGGYGPMGGSTYGGGRSSFGGSSHNTDRGTSELGGFQNH